jgi:hypothetical protein
VVEHLGVVGVEEQRAAVRDRTADEPDVGLEVELVVRVALELLERDRLAPDDREARAVGAECPLRRAPCLERPLRVAAVGVVPVGDDRLIPRLRVQRHEPRRVRLLAQHRRLGAHAEQRVVHVEPEPQVPAVDLGREQRRGALGV